MIEVQDSVRLCQKGIFATPDLRARIHNPLALVPTELSKGIYLHPEFSRSFSMCTLRLMTLLVIFQRNVVFSSTCYWPNEDAVSDRWGYVLCNSTANAVHSTCCAGGDLCTLEGYCFGHEGYMYRGACTDSSWEAQACCSSCRGRRYQSS